MKSGSAATLSGEDFSKQTVNQLNTSIRTKRCINVHSTSKEEIAVEGLREKEGVRGHQSETTVRQQKPPVV